MKKKIGVCVSLLIFFAGCHPGPSIAWKKYSPDVLQSAQQTHSPVLLYFYAAWCPSCMRLKYETFRDPRVVAALKAYQTIKVDLSYRGSPNTLEMNRRYHLSGLPTLIFLDSRGQEIPEARMLGYLPPDLFLAALQQISERAQTS